MRAFQSKHVELYTIFRKHDAESERVAQDVNRQMLIGVNAKGIFNVACDGTTISINPFVKRGFRRCDFMNLGTLALDKLDKYITYCDAVIHLVGEIAGLPLS